jgi:phage shock protein PspC (stress-responsive transcriptional regulator)
MKKTVSIHLGHQLFVIEEDAYDKIQAYLASLEKRMKAEEGLAEIMEDIEMRFAELLQGYLGASRKVVTLKDVSTAIASLGEPEDFSEESESVKEDANTNNEQPKRLFRDVKNEKIGGVAAGLAAYFHTDPVWIRIVFVLCMFMGFGVALYIVLWIVIPAAKTPAERLQMHGKKVTVDSLKAEFERSSEKIKSHVKNASQRVKTETGHFTTHMHKIVSKGVKIFAVLLLVFVSMVTFIFAAIAFGWLDVIPVTGDKSYASLHEFFSLFFPAGKALDFVWYGMLIFVFSLALICLVSCYSMLTAGNKRFVKIINTAGGIALGFAVLLIVLGSIQTARDYEVKAEIENAHTTINASKLFIEEVPLVINNRLVTGNDGLDFIWLKQGRIVENGIHLTIKESKDSLFHVYQQISAHGLDLTNAQKRSTRVKHFFKVEQSKLMIDPYYSFPTSDGLRNQEVEMIVMVPKGKQVFVKDELIEVKSWEITGVFEPNESFETYRD